MDTNSKLLGLLAFAAILTGGPVATASEFGLEQPLVPETTSELFQRLWDAGLIQVDERTGAIALDVDLLQKMKDAGLVVSGQAAGNAPLCTGICQ